MSKNRLFLIAFGIVALSLLAWGFFVFRDRNASPTPKAEEQQIQDEQQQSAESQKEETQNESAASQASSDDSQNTPSDDEETTEDSSVEKTNLLEISRNDCNNKCKDYHKDELEYCQQFCGISSKNESDQGDCKNLSGLKKDYCLKDLAAKESDLETCNEIEDSGIMKACRNIITENILDSQKQL